VTGVEKKPGPQSQLITGSETESIQYTDLQVNSPSEGTYAVLLSGFDLVRTDDNAEKFVRFELEVTKAENDPEPYTLTNGDVSFKIRYKLLFNCDSAECKFTDLNGPAQKVDYDLTVHYVLLEGSNRSLNVVRGSDLTNDDIQWSHCKNNKVKPTPWADESNFNDKWDNPLAFHPGNHMFCEDSENRQIHHENYWKTSTIYGKSGSSGSRYSVGAVGVKRMTLRAEGGTHYVQYDNVIGGNYTKESGTYDVRALPFWKEWSTRPGIHKKAALSFGHAGSAEVGVQPVLVQVRDGCKRGLVAAGGKHWPGKGKKPTGSDAVVSTSYQFDFGEHWVGYGGRGSLCQHTHEGEVEYTEYTSDNQAFSIAHTSGGKTAWKELQPYKNTRKHLIAERTAEEPTQLRGRLSDRYHSPSNLAPTGGSEISLSVRQGQERGQVSYYAGESTILDSSPSPEFITRNAGLFDPTDSGGDWPVFTVTPTQETRVETFLQNLETGETQWVGSSDGGGTSLTERVNDTGPYALETVFDGPRTGPTVATTRLWVKKYPTIRKRLKWTIRGDFETRTDISTATRSFTYEWSSGQHRRVRRGWRLTVNTDGGGGTQGGLSSPFDVHAFQRYFGAEVEGSGPVLDARVEAEGRELEKNSWHPHSLAPNHGEYPVSIFACYNVIAAHQHSDFFDCRAGADAIGVEKSVDHTIKVGDAYAPEQPEVSVKGLSRQPGSGGISYVDYEADRETLTFQWKRPKDRGNPSLGVSPQGLEKYRIEVSADGGRTYTVQERNFGEELSSTQVSGEKRMITVSFSRDGFHELRLWAIDEVGNESPGERVKICVQKPNCKTPGEEARDAAAAREARREMEAYQMMEDFLEQYGIGGPDLGDEDDPSDIIPGPDIGPGPGGGGPCRVCTAGNLNWVPRGERVNIYVQREEGRMEPYHALMQDGQVFRLGKSDLDNPTREITMTPGEMRSISNSNQPLKLIENAVQDRGHSPSEESPENSEGDQQPSDRAAGPQSSSPVKLTFLPKAGMFLSGVSSFDDISGEASSALDSKQSVFTWGGSVAFGSRDSGLNLRLTGFRTTGSLVSSTDGPRAQPAPEHLLLITGDLILRPLPRLLLQPYGIGGVGGRRLLIEGNTSTTQANSSWDATGQVGIGADLRLGNVTVGVEIVDYLTRSGGSGGELQHDAFAFLVLGVPIN
jgi:hypothetical protein